MTTPEKKKTNPSPYSQFFAEELNLSRLPFFASSTKGLKSKKKSEFRRTTEIDGREVEALWKVTANAEYGYPGPFAEAVHAAILQMVTERGFPVQNPIKFSFYDICKRLDIEPSGQNLNNIRNAIRSIRGALIEIKHSFQLKDGKRPRFEDLQNLYSRVIFFGDYDPQTDESVELSAVWLADFYRDSLNSGHIRPIDFEYFKQIREKSWAVTKIYQFLGYRFAVGCFGKHRNPYAKVDYEELCVIADIRQQQFLSKAKERLETAHTVLVETGFVDRIEWIEEGQEKAKKFYIRYYPGRRSREEYQKAHLAVSKQLSFRLEPVAVAKTSPVLIDDLSALGVSSVKASKLVGSFTAENIERQLDHLAYLGEINKPPSNTGAWLVKAIEEDYTPPSGFKDRKEREVDRKAQEEKEAELQRKELQEKKQEQEREGRYSELDARLFVLSKAEQKRISKKIEERIRAGLNSFMENMYKTKPLDIKAPMHRHDYYRHLANILSEAK